MAGPDEKTRREAEAAALGLRHPAVVAAQRAMAGRDPAAAERLLVAHLDAHPAAAGPLVMLGTLLERRGALEEAEARYRRAAEAAPGYLGAHLALVRLLASADRIDAALRAVDAASIHHPRDPDLLALRARLLWQARRLNEAAAAHRALLDLRPDDAAIWVNYGYVLKAQGDDAAAEDAFRRAPSVAAAWWGLANLKTVPLDRADATAMERALAAATDPRERTYLHFALGHARSGLGAPAAAMAHYHQGNALRRAQAPFDADRFDAAVERAAALFTAPFFAAREGWGSPLPDPIFIVGMPRSGSTLVEQILACHPAIEGTEELPAMSRIAADLARDDPDRDYLTAIGRLTAPAARALGGRYLAAAQRYRRTDRPLFTDKMPSNWLLAGLIHLILPNARIVDVRRHPMACGFANYVQYFDRGADFAYDLTDIGRFYAGYVGLMDQVDRELPGRIHRVFHERLVTDAAGEVRRLLNYLGLPFDPACLRPHEAQRAVFTPSAAQVRRPINRDGLERWREYAQWLDPLRAALGPVLDHYPDPPPA